MSKSRLKQQADPLTKWLALNWNRPERSYNPDVRDFLAGLLDYPKDRVVTEDAGGGGYPDIKLLTPEKIAWAQTDEAVYEMFRLTDDERDHIESRLASSPLNKLQPRYPWQTVKTRPIKAYTSDRFA